MEVAHKRDPGGIFQELPPGGFRLDQGCTVDSMQ